MCRIYRLTLIGHTFKIAIVKMIDRVVCGLVFLIVVVSCIVIENTCINSHAPGGLLAHMAAQTYYPAVPVRWLWRVHCTPLDPRDVSSINTRHSIHTHTAWQHCTVGITLWRHTFIRCESSGHSRHWRHALLDGNMIVQSLSVGCLSTLPWHGYGRFKCLA